MKALANGILGGLGGYAITDRIEGTVVDDPRMVTRKVIIRR